MLRPERTQRDPATAKLEGYGGVRVHEVSVSAYFGLSWYDAAWEPRCQLADEPKGKRVLGRQGASSEYASPFAEQLSDPLCPSGDGSAESDVYQALAYFEGS